MLYDIPGTPLNKMNISQITYEACKEAEIYLNVGIVSRYIELRMVKNSYQIVCLILNKTSEKSEQEISKVLPLCSFLGWLDH